MEIVTGMAVRDFLRRIRARLDRYEEIVLLSPYLDEATAVEARDILVEAEHARCGVRIVTRIDGAAKIWALLPGHRSKWSRAVQVRHRLHAKVYWAAGKTREQGEAIITSANFTIDGMTVNDELGVRITGASADGRHTLGTIRSSINKWLH